MEKKKSECMNCGKDITKKQRSDHEYKYCSRKCFCDAQYGNQIAVETIEARNPKYHEAAKLLREGYSQAEVVERLGVNKYTLNSWLRRHEAAYAAIFADRVCQYCGVSLANMPWLSKRKYCSETCGNKARYRQKHTMSTNRQYAPYVFEEAMEMYWRGIGGSAIARHFGIPEGTVLSWIHDFGKRRERREPLKNRVRSAKDAEVWLSALRDTSQTNDTAENITVHIVCGSVRGQSVNRLTTIISECLRADPFNGDVYAFCNNDRNIISTIVWTGTMFNIVLFPKLRGTYI